MSKINDEDEYHSSEDEDYTPPVDAPPENENDAFLINKEEPTSTKSSEPTKNIDDLWADFTKPTTSETSTTNTVSSSKPEPAVASGAKRKFESAPPKKASGFQAAISQMKKAKKMSVLEKSQSDWNKFVEKNSIKEELDIHKRSKDNYLENQDFLSKADYNKFVKERESREQNRKPT